MKYIAKKIMTMIITLLVVSLLVFFSFALISGDAATSQLGTSATPEKIEALREEMGLNRPLFIQYADWIIHFFTGDMGTSYVYNMPVSQMLSEKFPITLVLTFMSFIIMVIISIPIGIYAAKHEGGKVDHIIYILNQFIMSVPPFFAGIIITIIFGMIFRLFTPGGYISYTKSVIGFIGYLIFPAVAIALPRAAMTIKLLRSSLIEESKKDYTRTAYSRGNRTKDVLYKHVLKNAMIPVITFLGMSLADIFTGSIIIEQVFGIPGLGRILLTSISNRDFPVVQAIIVWMAMIIVLINMIVDIIYHYTDPRIHVE